VADIGNEMDMVGDEYLWLISGAALPPQLLIDSMVADPDSNLDRLLQGAGVFADYDPFYMNPIRDKFLESWKRQGGDLVTETNLYHPLDENHPSYFQGNNSYFQHNTPALQSSFIYDAIMSIGMSACQVEAEARKQQKNISNDDTDTIMMDGGAHLKQMFSTEFHGASGAVKFDLSDDDKGNGRDPNEMQFGMYNIRAVPQIDGNHRYKTVLTSVYKNLEWIDSVVDEEGTDTDFLYFDGTTNDPRPLFSKQFRKIYISNNILVVGWALVGIILATSLGFALLVFVCKNNRIVKASQPPFLLLICSGTFVMGLSIFTLGVDDKNASTANCSIACMSSIWLVAIGFTITFAALYSKIYRINKLVESASKFRKVVIEWKDVIKPFLI